MTSIEPQYCNRLIRGTGGRMIFIRANATAPDTRLNIDVHRRAAIIARRAISNPHRFATCADLNCSTETLNDDFVEMEFINSSANPWAARYSPYIGKGVPTKRRMSFHAHIDRIREKIFKKKPSTVLDVYDLNILRSRLKEEHATRKTIKEKLNYIILKWKLARLSLQERHEMAKEVMANDPRFDADPWNMSSQVDE